MTTEVVTEKPTSKTLVLNKSWNDINQWTWKLKTTKKNDWPPEYRNKIAVLAKEHEKFFDCLWTEDHHFCVDTWHPKITYVMNGHRQDMKTDLTMWPGGSRKFSIHNVLHEISQNTSFCVSGTVSSCFIIKITYHRWFVSWVSNLNWFQTSSEFIFSRVSFTFIEYWLHVYCLEIGRWPLPKHA